MYDFKETARIKNCEVAYDFTHCHKDGKDEIAKIMYFFNVTFDVKDKKEVTLPIDNDIVIISAATLNSETAEIKTQLLEEVEPRKFNFKMTRQEKHNYRVERRYKNMGDKKFYERKGWGKDY